MRCVLLHSDEMILNTLQQEPNAYVLSREVMPSYEYYLNFALYLHAIGETHCSD